MDKTSSVIAAFEAGKLPSTHQFNSFIKWSSDVGITHLEPSANTALSSQGRVLANDLRQILDAYEQLANNKNGTRTSKFLSVIPLLIFLKSRQCSSAGYLAFNSRRSHYDFRGSRRQRQSPR